MGTSGAATSVVTRPIAEAERRAVQVHFDWATLATGLAGAAVAVVLAAVVAGLPLYLVLRVVGVSDAWSWVQLGLWLVAVATVPWIVAVPLRYVRARWALHRALDAGVVEDLVLQVTGAVEVGFDAIGSTGYYLRCHDGAVFLFVGDYLAPLRRAGVFPSTALRLVRLPGFGAVALLPIGDPLQPAAVIDGQRFARPTGNDGDQVEVDFDALLALALG